MSLRPPGVRIAVACRLRPAVIDAGATPRESLWNTPRTWFLVASFVVGGVIIRPPPSSRPLLFRCGRLERARSDQSLRGNVLRRLPQHRGQDRRACASTRSARKMSATTRRRGRKSSESSSRGKCRPQTRCARRLARTRRSSHCSPVRSTVRLPRSPDPGRTVTFRRLTRTEYQNAIRDLLALDIDAAALLPKDESSLGFDNVTVGDLSPTLLERYITAAQRISRLAVGRHWSLPRRRHDPHPSRPHSGGSRRRAANRDARRGVDPIHFPGRRRI